MEICTWEDSYTDSVISLWNEEAVHDGYKPLSRDSFASLICGSPYFDANTTFVARCNGEAVGFACGCTGDDLPLGAGSGYITCIIVKSRLGAEGEELALRLLERLEDRFRELGKKQADLLFFNPMRLPWLVPNTSGHEHNNAPGAPESGALHRLLLAAGYAERSLQCGMYLPLAKFVIPDEIRDKECRAGDQGYAVELLDAARHEGLSELLTALGNPVWQREIAACVERGLPVVAAVLVGAQQVEGVAPRLRGNSTASVKLAELPPPEGISGVKHSALPLGGGESVDARSGSPRELRSGSKLRNSAEFQLSGQPEHPGMFLSGRHATAGRVVGFAGPVIREESGRGYFAGIGVHPEHEGHGLGSLLFYGLCEAFKEIGTDYMTLFTGSENPALRIYDKAGFRTVKRFAVMRKEFTS